MDGNVATDMLTYTSEKLYRCDVCDKKVCLDRMTYKAPGQSYRGDDDDDDDDDDDIWWWSSWLYDGYGDDDDGMMMLKMMYSNRFDWKGHLTTHMVMCKGVENLQM